MDFVVRKFTSESNCTILFAFVFGMSAKERKVHTGATNLSARSERGSLIKKEFFRSWTHKLISPDVYIPPEKEADHIHVYRNTATWRPVPCYERKFATTQEDSYKNPKDVEAPPDLHFKSSEQLAREKEIKTKQLNAVEALCRTAKAHFGTTAAMLKVVSFLKCIIVIFYLGNAMLVRLCTNAVLLITIITFTVQQKE